MNSILSILCLVFLSTAFFCIAQPETSKSDSSFVDPRDGKIYKTVKIGDQIWMAENLNYDSEILTKDGSFLNDWCEQCDKYGRLYCWDAAIVVCPKGWHLPTMDEWLILFRNTGGKGSKLGCVLKSTSGWKKINKCMTNSSGFSALPGGMIIRGKPRYVGETAVFWMATYANSFYETAWYFDLPEANQRQASGVISMSVGNSVRCVRDK